MEKSANVVENSREMHFRSVGVVRSPLKEPSLVVDSGDLDFRQQMAITGDSSKVISELIIDGDLTGIANGIEDFSHILVLYWAHLVDEKGRSILQAHPMGRKDLPLKGIYATCSPARPNPVCAMIVRLLERKGNVLKVQGLDAIDGSPIIDIKPYNPSYYAAENIHVADWMQKIHREFSDEKLSGKYGSR
jgi:tRNA-Thr(GGU) m(6)t(6)A37 methyltransferase TsaA